MQIVLPLYSTSGGNGKLSRFGFLISTRTPPGSEAGFPTYRYVGCSTPRCTNFVSTTRPWTVASCPTSFDASLQGMASGQAAAISSAETIFSSPHPAAISSAAMQAQKSASRFIVLVLWVQSKARDASAPRDPGKRDSPHEILLGGEEQYENRDQHHHGRCHQEIPPWKTAEALAIEEEAQVKRQRPPLFG